jgi:predicted small lipoprotein YifL
MIRLKGEHARSDGDHMSVRRRHIAYAAITVVLLSGCGQKGPLYMPEMKGSVVKPVTPAPEAATPSGKIDPEQKDDSQQQPPQTP